MGRLGTESAFEVLQRAKALEAQGKSIVHMEIGEPDFDTPSNVIDAAVGALKSGWTHYTPAAGIPQLRETIAAYTRKTRGIDVTAENVVVFPGAKPTMSYLILAMIDPGDEVIYPNPGFPIYESMIEFAGGKAVPVPLLEDRDFGFDASTVASLITPKTKMIILNSPGNPTGGVLSKELITEVAALAKKHDIFVLADEIYSRILYDGGKFFSITQVPGMFERTCILDGFSKTYSMTGWRLGWAVLPKEVAQRLTQLAINFTSCTAAFSQIAGVEALEGDQASVDRMCAEFDARRRLIVDGLNKIPGVRCRKPGGAFYVFPNISGTGLKSKEFSDRLLNEGGVAALPGTAFGRFGEGFLRLSFATSQDKIEEALERMAKFCASVTKR
jgi:aspartate aminotransferase